MRAMKQSLSTAVAVIGVLALIQAASASVVFEEHFNYADEDALAAAWTKVDGQGAYLQLGPRQNSSDPTVSSDPYAVVSNGLITRDLSQTVTHDFTLTFQVLHNADQRGTYVALLDASGEHGYAAYWDSGNGGGGPSDGNVSIHKFDLTSAIGRWSQNGTQLGSAADSGHENSTLPFAIFQLKWTAATGALTLSVDGTTKVTTTDTDFSSFSRIYIKGNTSQYYDDILLTTVPEPGSLALLGLGGLVMLSRKRRG